MVWWMGSKNSNRKVFVSLHRKSFPENLLWVRWSKASRAKIGPWFWCHHSKLNFSEHIAKITKTTFFLLHHILRILKTKDLETLIFAFKTYIRPHLEYCTVVWNPQFKYDSDRIEKVQKLFTKKALKQSGHKKECYEERLKICGLKTYLNVALCMI